MKKFVFVSLNNIPWGGSEYLWNLTARNFLDNGYEVEASVAKVAQLPVKIAELQQEGGIIHKRQWIPLSALQQRLNRLLPLPRQFKPRFNAYDILNGSKPALVVFSQGANFEGVEWMEECIKRNIPYVTVCQAVTELIWPDDAMCERAARVLEASRKNYFVSKANLRLMQTLIAQPIPNGEVIRNPFNVPYHSDFEFPPVEDTYKLANVARHQIGIKGIELFLQVLSDTKWQQRPLQVNMYGEGMHTRTIEKMLGFFGLTNVFVRGQQNTVDIWKENHALLLTSRFEGLPLALVEAMLCGRTSIVTAVSGIPEVVVDNENAFVAKYPSVEEIDEALERAWQRKDDWEQMGRNAKTYIKSLVPEDPIQIFYENLLLLV